MKVFLQQDLVGLQGRTTYPPTPSLEPMIYSPLLGGREPVVIHTRIPSPEFRSAYILIVYRAN